ncbi:hypothetical protein F0562_035799 [Nyssa sinensis]|uniref:Phytosulfokine n=1 Tax=Nyssa sinensis TaxID=561372 RepID=A0A5J5ADV4_9ASTE|nr:hypothetical protein F0562_035799 [Nyssa sinensis]
MAKPSALFMIALLLFFLLTCSARPGPSPVIKTQSEDAETGNNEVDEASCEGVDKEECLMRRTLAAHVDYIYTQKQKP